MSGEIYELMNAMDYENKSGFEIEHECKSVVSVNRYNDLKTDLKNKKYI